MAKNKKYDELAEAIVRLVGGKGNIKFLAHCVTRLRFNVKDKSLINVEELEQLNGVVGCRWSGDQLQVIIGQHVGEVFQIVSEKIDYQATSSATTVTSENKSEKKRFNISKVFDAISGCMTPLIPLLIGGGMLKAILLILQQLSLITPENATYIVLSFVGDAAFYFLPVFVGAMGARKFGANMVYGMLIGASLLHPQFLEQVAKGTQLSVFNLPIPSIPYYNSIIPMILSTFILSYVEKYVTKFTPKILQSMLVPVLTLLIMIPLTFCLLAPIGAIVGTYLASGISWLYETTGFLAVGLTCAAYVLLCLTGMHTALLPVGLTMLTTVGYEPLLTTAAVIYTINQGIVALVVAVKTKDIEERSTALTCTITALVAGISEPSLFGFTLKNKRLLVCSMIGCFFGGIYAGITHVYCYAIAGSVGLLVFPGYVGPDPMNLINGAIALAISCAVTFVLGMVFGYRETDSEGKNARLKNKKEKNVEVA